MEKVKEVGRRLLLLLLVRRCRRSWGEWSPYEASTGIGADSIVELT